MVEKVGGWGGGLTCLFLLKPLKISQLKIPFKIWEFPNLGIPKFTNEGVFALGYKSEIQAYKIINSQKNRHKRFHFDK
jgi:hypothetical protein